MFVEISENHFVNFDYMESAYDIAGKWTIVMRSGVEYSIDDEYSVDFCKALKENCLPWEKYNS